MDSERRLEDQLRRMARKQGYRLKKSRVREVHGNNLGEYMLVEENRNLVVLGARFDADLNEIKQYLEKD